MLRRLLPPAGSARTLTLITLTHTVGQGLWMAINAIFVTTVVGLTPGQFAIGLGVSAGVALALSTPAGHLADRVGPRVVQVSSFLALAPLTAVLMLVETFPQYVLVMAFQAVAYSGSRSARMAMIAGLVPPDQRVTVRAYLRATSNVSVSVGAGMAGVLLAVGSEPAYRWAVVFSAVTYAVAGLLSLLLPPVASQAVRPGPRLEVLRDRPYLTFVVLDGVLSMHYLLLDVVLPLWVLRNTEAPRWMVAFILLVNTVVVALLQVRFSRGTDEPAAAATVVRRGALLLAFACVIFGFSDGVSPLTASLLLGLGALVHVLGEMKQAAGSWGISFGLAPDHAQGQYQGTYAMGADLGKMVAPALLAWLTLQYETAGWMVVAGMFVVAGAAVPAVVTWAARRTRAPEAVLT